MPSDDYTPVVRGALKLKGSGPAGITKKKKKKAKPSAEAESSKTAIQKALEDEDAIASKELKNTADLNEEELRELESRGTDGKTATERAYEEMRRKRVRPGFALVCILLGRC